MTDQSDQRPKVQKLQLIDRATLTPLVRHALNSETYDSSFDDFKCAKAE